MNKEQYDNIGIKQASKVLPRLEPNNLNLRVFTMCFISYHIYIIVKSCH